MDKILFCAKNLLVEICVGGFAGELADVLLDLLTVAQSQLQIFSEFVDAQFLCISSFLLCSKS